jgi:DNA uptake protein ComE-like DNA-binding protein
LAEGIIAHRPYQTADDLLKVRGIGTNLLERIRGFIRVTSEAK